MNFLTCHLFAGVIADVVQVEPLKIFTAPPGDLLNFNPYNILAGLVFGAIGWGAFAYGKKLDLWQPRAIGVALMVYPYFFSNAWVLWGAGVGLMVALWFYHGE